MNCISLKLIGPCPSKKNLYSRSGNTQGKRGMFINKKVQAKIDYLAMQIPPELRNLKLEHPGVMYQFYLPKNTKHHRPWESDWDGRVTLLQDLLVKFGVFREDSFTRHNGTKLIPPAIEIDGPDEVVITITPQGDIEPMEVAA